MPCATNFPFAEKIHGESAKAGLPIDELTVVIEPASGETIYVTKALGAAFKVEDATALVPLEEIQVYHPAKKRWWGWLGIKDVPGHYKDADVRGIRVRAKNIQIDGEALVRQIFEQRSASNKRYQDWFVGEIFVDPRALTPNARRDGFEDTPAWREVQKEIAATVCKDAGSSAQNISNKGQLTLLKLTEKAVALEENLKSLDTKGPKATDKAIELSASATKLHAQVARPSGTQRPSPKASCNTFRPVSWT